MEQQIKNFETYTISTNGIVKCCRTGNFISQHDDPQGYKTVNIRNPQGWKIARVHRLVAESFIANPNNYLEVDHIDRNKNNNNIENLRWANDFIQSVNRSAHSNKKGGYPKYIHYEQAGSKNYAAFTVQIYNHIIHIKKRFRSDKYTLQDAITFRNKILSDNKIDIID